MKHLIPSNTPIALLAILGSLSIGTLTGCLSDDAEERDLYVEHYMAPCQGFAPQLCMQTRENGTDGPLENFYDSIDGFTFEWGHRYELRVSVTEVEEPPPDGSALDYDLLEVISDTPITDEFNLKLTAEYINGDPATNAFSLLGYRDVTCESPETCENIAVWLDAESAVDVEVAHSADDTGPLLIKSASEAPL